MKNPDNYLEKLENFEYNWKNIKNNWIITETGNSKYSGSRTMTWGRIYCILVELGVPNVLHISWTRCA